MTTREIIIKYYQNNELDVLDEGIPHGGYSKTNYLAVSLDYIYEYVLKKKISRRFIAKIIFKLCQEKIIFPIPCDHADNLVFCKYEFQKDKWFSKFSVGKKEIENKGYTCDRYMKYLSYFNSFLNN